MYICMCVCDTGVYMYRDKLDTSLKAVLGDFVSDGGIRKWNQVDSDVIFNYIINLPSSSSSVCNTLWRLEDWRPSNL